MYVAHLIFTLISLKQLINAHRIILMWFGFHVWVPTVIHVLYHEIIVLFILEQISRKFQDYLLC